MENIQMEMESSDNSELVVTEAYKTEKGIEETIWLYKKWKSFLKKAGSYAKRYYLFRSLEAEVPDQKVLRVFDLYYGSMDNLEHLIAKDIDKMRNDLRILSDMQARLDLGPFATSEEYVDRIIMGFALHERHGKQRREYYASRINKELRKEVPERFSLNELEAAFQKTKASQS